MSNLEIIPIEYANSVFGENNIFQNGDAKKLRPIVFMIFLIKTENRLILVDAGCEAMPDFDLRNEIRGNKLFSQMLLSGVPVKTAYETVHREEIFSGAMAYTAGKVREQVVKGIQAKGMRPMENGISSESAIVTSVDVNNLTSQDILKILKQVENGASIKF